MPEMLPCPLLMNRYNNPAFNIAEDSEGEPTAATDTADADNYLDPERDYELINDLRKFILNNGEAEELEDAHYAACDKS